MAKKLVRPEFEDFQIKDNGVVVGDIRVKASGILWRPKGKHSWHRVSIADFANYAEANGTKQTK